MDSGASAPTRWLADFPTAPRACALALTLLGAHAGFAQTIREVGAITIQTAGSPAERPVFSPEQLAERLSSFIGRPCEPARIAESLARIYRFLGYVPSIDASCPEGTLSVSVRESNQTIRLIAFDESELALLGIVRNPDYHDSRGLYPVSPKAPRAALRGLLQTAEGDLYNSERYRSESSLLQRFGYALAVVPGAPSEPGGLPRSAYLVRSLAPAGGGVDASRTKSNYIGGTASYGPRIGTTLGVRYEKDSLFLPLDRLSVAPSYNAGTGGELSYLAPLLAAREAPRRLYDVELKAFSDYRHNRLLDGVETDERRSGAGLTLGWRILNLSAPHALRLSAGARYESTTLEDPAPGQEGEDLALLRLGAAYEWRHTYRWPSLTARVAPSADLAFAVAGGDRSFVRPGLEAMLHQRFLGGWESHFSFSGGTLDRHVPSFELWSLGGEATLRGFPEDAFLGRHMAALQSEIWLPIFHPRSGDAAAPVSEPRLGRFLKGALFVDGGTMSGLSGGGNEGALGAGVGLRFFVPRNPLVFRLDYGWGFGAPGEGAHFYFSLGYRP